MTTETRTLEAVVDTFAHGLVCVLLNRQIHGPGTEDRRCDFRAIARDLENAFVAGVPEPLEIAVGLECLAWRGAALLAASLQAKRLLALCLTRGIAALEFARGADAEQFERFLDLLSDERRKDAFEPQQIAASLASAGVTKIRATAIQSRRLAVAGPDPSGIRHYQGLADVLQRSHVAAARGDEIGIDDTRGFVERALDQMEESPSMLLTLATYDQIDSFTVGHSVRVALLAMHVARAARASRIDLLRVGTAALLHDIGKSKVPQQVLFKQGRLDAEERELMALHPRHGAEILVQQRHIDEAAVGAAFCHHMGPRSTGYPVPYLPFEPSGISKLVRLCDVFEAITAVRPYKKALPPLQAFTLMRRMRDGFDPDWFRFFVRTIGVYSKGTRVILDGGQEGVVVEIGEDPNRPVVRVSDGSREPRTVQVGVADDGAVREVRAFAAGEAVLPHLEPHEHYGGCCGCTDPSSHGPQGTHR